MMKMMKVVSMGLMMVLLLGAGSDASAQFWKFKKKKAKVETKVKKKKPKLSKYDKLIKGADVKKGLFNIIQKGEKVYLEIPKNVFGKDFLITSRVTKVSNNKNIGAGRMPKNPVRVRFTADTSKLYMNRPTCVRLCDKNSEIFEAFKRNNIDPIWKSFKIEAYNNDSTAIVADFTKLFFAKEYEFNPFVPYGTIMDLIAPFHGSLDKSRSKVTSVKAFDENIQVKLLMSYTIGDYPYTVEMTRNIIQLPDTPMRFRYSDPRLGYFEGRFLTFDENGADERRLIHRWNLVPKDIEAYKRGELVEPVKPIVWYVDSAIPSKWRQCVIDGIEDWQEAFEEIGFKNAIVAREYPSKEEDPNFDPDDIKYNCYRYIPTPVKNSMGPSWIDPRSGEILGGDVLFYSNVVKLLQDWRFVQTAQIDPRVRSKKMNDKLVGESLRYVAAHEIGHTLGLMHNFIASATYPVDSLRSAKFTQEYGTTPSIMDYARYNYVAQPGDKGLKLTPPKLGIYDKFQIKLGYKYIPDTKTCQEDFDVIKKWLFEKKDDVRYTYVNPYIQKGYINAVNTTEAVGDDAVKATQYGIKNLKFIEKNLVKWLMENGDDYKFLADNHIGIATQFYRYMHHVLPLIGGEYRTPIYEGYNIDFQKYVSKKKQKQALNFILKELRNFPKWWDRADVEKRIGKNTISNNVQNKVFSKLFSKNIAEALTRHEFTGVKNCYTYKEFQQDIFRNVWNRSSANKSITMNDKGFQTLYVSALINTVKPKKAPKGFKLGILTLTDEEISMNELSQPMVEALDYPMIANMAKKTLNLLKRLKSTGYYKDRMHYEALYFKLDKALNK